MASDSTKDRYTVKFRDQSALGFWLFPQRFTSKEKMVEERLDAFERSKISFGERRSSGEVQRPPLRRGLASSPLAGNLEDREESIGAA